MVENPGLGGGTCKDRLLCLYLVVSQALTAQTQAGGPVGVRSYSVHPTLKLPVTARKDGRGEQAASFGSRGALGSLLEEADANLDSEHSMCKGTGEWLFFFFTISELYVVKDTLWGGGV